MANERYTANYIKMIAIVAMTIDHLTWLFYPGFSTGVLPIGLHLVGRLTAPIMWFFVAEGYAHTSNKYRYFRRLMILAIVSHFAFCFSFGLDYIPFRQGIFNQTSVAYSLALSVLLLMMYEWEGNPFIRILGIVAIIFLAFPADWSSISVVSIMYFYANRGDIQKQGKWLVVWIALYAVIYFIFIDKVYAIVQFGTLNSLFILCKYNGKLGNNKYIGKFFYYYYPVHMVLIGVLRLMLYGNQNILF